MPETLETPVLIVGAGLSGLTAARALPAGSFVMIDSNTEPGGLCRSVRHEGYTFDFTGHLLQLKGEILREVEELLGDNLAVIERRARIHAQGVELEYPFQLNFGGLPDRAAVAECMAGLEGAIASEPDRTNFGTWCRTVFGDGIYRHFMKPYNEKLYRSRLEEMASDWVGWIPRPSIEELAAVKRGEIVSKVGYNAVFRYPKRGGIGALPAALAAGLPIRLETSLVSLDVDSRTALIRSARGEETRIRYQRLISTAPLPTLLGMIAPPAPAIIDAARSLEAVGVICLNLGIDGPTSDAHWIYFPEAKFPFFRVGFYHNFVESVAPRGKSALYVELSYRKRSDLPEDYRTAAIRGLIDAGIIDRPERVETCLELRIDAAYGLHTPARRTALEVIRPYLDELGIIPIGRYGRWAYTSMGEALSEGRAAGKKAAEALGI